MLHAKKKCCRLEACGRRRRGVCLHTISYTHGLQMAQHMLLKWLDFTSVWGWGGRLTLSSILHQRMKFFVSILLSLRMIGRWSCISLQGPPRLKCSYVVLHSAKASTRCSVFSLCAFPTPHPRKKIPIGPIVYLNWEKNLKIIIIIKNIHSLRIQRAHICSQQPPAVMSIFQAVSYKYIFWSLTFRLWWWSSPSPPRETSSTVPSRAGRLLFPPSPSK